MADQVPQVSQPPPPPPLGLEQQLAQWDAFGTAASNQQPIRRPVITPHPADRRPFDELGRPPANPIPFERARYQRGRRANVLCYNPTNDTHDQLRNVLLREIQGGEFDTNNNNDDDPTARVGVQYAYHPFKDPIKTIMGHVEICQVLERCKRHRDDDELDSDSENDYDNDDDDDDIVFQYTDRRVAVKVNYISTMERLRGRHAEDPLKEIAAMQLLGADHPNVLGCIEVLYDLQNINVVMPFCDSGDLFQLLQDTQARNAGDGTNNDAPPGLSEGQSRYWFRQIVSGIQYMHEQCGICHRDLSPENVMIDQNTRSIVIDMGMCLRVPYQLIDPQQQLQQIPQTEPVITDLKTAIRSGAQPLHGNSTTILPPLPPLTTTTPGNIIITQTTGGTSTLRRRRCLIAPQGTCGKLPYMSPEIYRNRDPFDGEAADIWTAGTILFCMITGNRSYQRPHHTDAQFYWMTMGLEQLLQDWNVTMSPEGVHLLKNMLVVDPRLRLTLQEVVNHPWFDFPDELPTPVSDLVMDFNLDDDDD